MTQNAYGALPGCLRGSDCPEYGGYGLLILLRRKLGGIAVQLLPHGPVRSRLRIQAAVQPGVFEQKQRAGALIAVRNFQSRRYRGSARIKNRKFQQQGRTFQIVHQIGHGLRLRMQGGQYTDKLPRGLKVEMGGKTSGQQGKQQVKEPRENEVVRGSG